MPENPFRTVHFPVGLDVGVKDEANQFIGQAFIPAFKDEPGAFDTHDYRRVNAEMLISTLLIHNIVLLGQALAVAVDLSEVPHDLERLIRFDDELNTYRIYPDIIESIFHKEEMFHRLNDSFPMLLEQPARYATLHLIVSDIQLQSPLRIRLLPHLRVALRNTADIAGILVAVHVLFLDVSASSPEDLKCDTLDIKVEQSVESRDSELFDSLYHGFLQNLSAANNVLAIQTALKYSGYDPGPLDGIVGPKTRAAMKKFAEDQEVDFSGNQHDQDFLKSLAKSAASSFTISIPEN